MKILSFDVGIVNLAYCIYDSQNHKIHHWEVITLENTKDYSKLYVDLINSLDSRKHLVESIDIVLIEKQPSFNPKMRIIAGCLQTYFYIRGVVDSVTHKIKLIKFYSPKHKLKCYEGDDLVVTGKTKYARTKKMGILICREKLREYNEPKEIVNIFENSKKKDDLADSYLQAITYCLQNVTEKPEKVVKITKLFLKKTLKEHLDKYCTGSKLSVIEIMNKDYSNLINTVKNYKYIHELQPVDQDNISQFLESFGMKSYLNKSFTQVN